jgi:SAM-dependent methyltransferase
MTSITYTGASHRDYLGEHIRDVPLFRALLRAVECRLYEEAGPLPEPVLDLGCGDGHYAQLTFARPLFAGLDPDFAVIMQETRERGAYRFPMVASATEIPFAEETFNSAIANCVVEHIPDIEAVMSETARVLRPGGRFVFGVPSNYFAEMLLGSTVLRTLGLEELGGMYGDWFNLHSQHFHTDSLETWLDRLHRHGFVVDHHEYYVDTTTHQLFDLLHYASVPRLISRRLTGKWNPVPNPLSQSFFDWLLRPHFNKPAPEKGAYLFFHARKA